MIVLEVPFTILSLLSNNQPWKGLALVNAAPRVLKRGAIYVWLDAMEDQGLLSSQALPPAFPGASSQMEYRIAPKGRVQLDRWTEAKQRGFFDTLSPPAWAPST